VNDAQQHSHAPSDDDVALTAPPWRALVRRAASRIRRRRQLAGAPINYGRVRRTGSSAAQPGGGGIAAARATAECFVRCL